MTALDQLGRVIPADWSAILELAAPDSGSVLTAEQSAGGESVEDEGRIRLPLRLGSSGIAEVSLSVLPLAKERVELELRLTGLPFTVADRVIPMVPNALDSDCSGSISSDDLVRIQRQLRSCGELGLSDCSSLGVGRSEMPLFALRQVQYAGATLSSGEEGIPSRQLRDDPNFADYYDVNYDGILDTRDIRIMLRYRAGLRGFLLGPRVNHAKLYSLLNSR